MMCDPGNAVSGHGFLIAAAIPVAADLPPRLQPDLLADLLAGTGNVSPIVEVYLWLPGFPWGGTNGRRSRDQ